MQTIVIWQAIFGGNAEHLRVGECACTEHLTHFEASKKKQNHRQMTFLTSTLKQCTASGVGLTEDLKEKEFMTRWFSSEFVTQLS